MRLIVHFTARRLEGATLMGLLGVMLSLLLLAGCARKEAPAPEAQPATSAETAATPSTTTAAEAMPATTETAPETTAAAPVPATASTTRSPAPTTSPAPGRAQSLPASPGKSAAPAAPAAEPQSAPAATPAPPAPVAAAPAASKVDDPGGPVAVASTNPGATRIGPEKCRICHKIQYASWAESPHARRSPPLECESCHGPGSEYKTVSTMKDLEKAKAAGLVLPDAKFCATCHKQDWKSDMLSKAHAHKAKPAA